MIAHIWKVGRRSLAIALLWGLLCVCLWHPPGWAQSTPPLLPEESAGYPVILQDQTLFRIEEGVASFPASFRAQTISERIEAFAKRSELEPEQLRIVENDRAQTVDIRWSTQVIATITQADADAADTTQQALAQDYLQVIQAAVVSYRRSYNPQVIALGALLTLGLTIALILSIVLINRFVVLSKGRLRLWQGDRIRGMRVFGVELIPADRVADFLFELIKLARLGLLLLLLGLYINLTLSFFPWTKGLSQQIFSYFQQAILDLWQSLLSYLPNLFFIGLIIAITGYTLRLVKFTFAEIRRGNITIPGFYPEWARPTYNILRFAILAFAATVAFPYLPGAETPAFQGISIFLGVLFSLGSSGAVANFVAGIILTYSRAFVVGDRVKISDSTGDVIEKTLLVTRINTPKNVIVTIPNAMVLGSHIINYSNSLRNEKTPPLVLHTTITLGYDVPWQQVHAVLVEAAKATQHILEEPAPFVLQTSLDDFYVSYELNAYTNTAALMPRIYSEMHQHVQDGCNAVGIEILSPHYAAMRDANQLTVPPDYIPKDYTAPGFRLFSLNQLFSPSQVNDNGQPPAPEASSAEDT
ncbi:MAG: mechanosensitive ion channel family protein [Leptolyngbya sp. SIO4C1]|nr:mechanosensitive ion channel family protein [Leptolyngbya sp. SIO4C1]